MNSQYEVEAVLAVSNIRKELQGKYLLRALIELYETVCEVGWHIASYLLAAFFLAYFGVPFVEQIIR